MPPKRNPLDDIRTAEDIDMVIMRGHVYGRKAIDARFGKTRAQVVIREGQARNQCRRALRDSGISIRLYR